MAVVLLSSRSMTRAGVRAVSMRGAVLTVIAASLLLTAGSFSAGILLGKHLKAEEVHVVAAAVTTDPVRERYTLQRLGELSGRLLRLESDAVTLVKRIATLDSFNSKLRNLPGGSAAVNSGTANSSRNAGGPALSPQPCDDPQAVMQAVAAADQKIARTENSLNCLQDVLARVERAAAERSIAYMAVPGRRPIENASVGSSFGNRVDPFNGRAAFHSGLDFAAHSGTPILAAGGGRVTVAGWRNEMGNMVEIDHGNGLVTRYAHASRVMVKVGDVVGPRQAIAAVGSTGRSTGPHLHFEILHQGRYVDPARYLNVFAGVPNV